MGRVAHYKQRTADRKAAGVPMIGPAPRPTGGLQRTALPVLRAPCPLQGDLVAECSTCTGPNEARRTYWCDHEGNTDGRCTRGNEKSGLWTCATCDHHPDAPRTKAAAIIPTNIPRAGDPGCGIVVGVYKWAALARLQVRAIRATCGPVPVLVVNDDPTIRDELERQVADLDDVSTSTNPVRLGHTDGDLSAFRQGLCWAKERGLTHLAKLSQRMIPLGPYWLQDSAKELIASGYATSTRASNDARWPIRTECVLMDVGRWSQSDVASQLAPGLCDAGAPGWVPVEKHLQAVIREQLGGAYWPMALLAPDRRTTGAYLWHHSNTVSEYRELAQHFDVALPESFSVAGWEDDHRAGTYLY